MFDQTAGHHSLARLTYKFNHHTHIQCRYQIAEIKYIKSIKRLLTGAKEKEEYCFTVNSLKFCDPPLS